MTLQKPRQDRPLQRTRTVCSSQAGRKGRLQRGLSFRLPAVERLARDAQFLADSRDHSIAATVGQQCAYPLCLLTGCARMCLVHWFLPGDDGNLFDPPYLPGSPLATAAHTVTPVSLSFEPCQIERGPLSESAR